MAIALSYQAPSIGNQLPVSVYHSTCQYFQMFLGNLSVSKNLFSLIALRYRCVCVGVCVWGLYALYLENMYI